ncbi:MAG: orotidine-5-phosphate decarboxylase, partial [Pseudomonadota bacterium]
MREIAPTLPLLIPGVGAQGGDAEATVKAGLTDAGTIVVNSSRAVLYASQGEDFAEAAAVMVSPFMGRDTVEPFLAYAYKGVILLCRTSNPGGN